MPTKTTKTVTTKTVTTTSNKVSGKTKPKKKVKPFDPIRHDPFGKGGTLR